MTIETNWGSSKSGIGYNFKLIEYPNGSAQIRIYDEPLELSERPFKKKLVREPFEKTLVREVKEFRSEADPLESRRVSLARTKRMISEYARSVRWEWFATFTFSPAKTDRTDYKKCSKKMRTWLRNTRKRKAKELQYLAVPELHKDMKSWHFHVLMANTGKLDFIDSGIIKDGKVIFNIPGWKAGFSTATKVQETYGIQKYIVKYMTKACHVLSNGAHRYFVSQDLPQPKKSIFVVEPGEEMELVQDLEESLGLTISWISRPIEGYVGVTYIDLEPYKTEISKEL